MQSVTTQINGDVLAILVNNPPVNALSWHVRQGLKDGIAEGLGNPVVKAIVLRCEGSTFIAGADITEFTQAPKEPGLHDTLDAMEQAAKPVIAAIHGTEFTCASIRIKTVYTVFDEPVDIASKRVFVEFAARVDRGNVGGKYSR